MEKVLFLDFDGVLFDTVEEAYYVACHAMGLATIDFNSSEYREFRNYRHLVAPAWNYFYVMKTLIENKEISYFEYNDAAKNFENNYFKTREILKKQDYKFWLSLNKPYDFLKMLKNLVQTIEMKAYVITVKDTDTILNLLNQFEIEFIKKDNILGKDDFEKFGSKNKLISNILNHLKSYKAVFIDDFDKHLLDCKMIKDLDLIQANWGYVDKDNLTVYQMNQTDAIEKIRNILS